MENKASERLFISAIESGYLNQVKFFFENRISTTTLHYLDGKHIFYVAATKGKNFVRNINELIRG